MQVSIQPAYILHARPYRETSLILDLFTEQHGRIHAVARGAKRKSNAVLQPFVPLMIAWTGRKELKTLTQIETQSANSLLTGNWLYSALYINEILTRLLRSEDPHPQLFLHYQAAIECFVKQDSIVHILRKFEKRVLAEMGYALPLSVESISADKKYAYDPDHGFAEINASSTTNQPHYFSGEDLLAIAHDNYQSDNVAQTAKRLMRMALRPHLGDKPLVSRQFFSKSHHDVQLNKKLG